MYVHGQQKEIPSLKSEYKVCGKCRKKLYQLQLKSTNLFLKQEADFLNKTNNGNEINKTAERQLCSLMTNHNTVLSSLHIITAWQ
jgi:hypothetical protein